VGDYVKSIVREMNNVDENGRLPNLVAEGPPMLMAGTWVDAFAPLGETFGLKL
jgi:hypothetical protein